MRVLALLPLVSLAVAAPSPLSARAAPDNSAQVVQELGTLTTDLGSLNQTLNSFEPDEILGLFTALKIQQQTSQLNDDIQQATSLTDASSVWSQAESLDVATAILNLEPVIFSVLDNIVRHKPAFATAVLFVGDLSETVEQNLETQRSLTASFGDAVVPKLDPSLQPLAPGQTQTILSHFDAAIAAYQACSGLICLPPF